MKQHKWIGIGGSIASGKSTLSRFIRQAGYTVIDADQISRQVVEPDTPGYQAVRDHFPKAFDGDELNRSKLGKVIFSDPKKRQLLNSLLHPLIIQESRRQLEAVDGLAFFEAPLLFESEMLEDFDLTIYVTASRNIQIERLMQRDGISRDYAEQKLATFKEPGNKPSIILQNNGTLEEFKAAASELLMRLTA